MFFYIFFPLHVCPCVSAPHPLSLRPLTAVRSMLPSLVRATSEARGCNSLLKRGGQHNVSSLGMAWHSIASHHHMSSHVHELARHGMACDGVVQCTWHGMAVHCFTPFAYHSISFLNTIQRDPSGASASSGTDNQYCEPTTFDPFHLHVNIAECHFVRFAL